jgi:hypothetical protein
MGDRVAVIVGTGCFVLLLAVGQMIIAPAARAAVPAFANEQHLGSYYGMYASIGGILVLPASTALGAIVDAVPDTATGRATPWLATAAVLVVGACLVLRVMAQRTVDPRRN